MEEANNRPVCDGSPAAGQPSDLSQHNTHNSPASTDKPDSVESRPPAPAAAPGLHGIAQPPEDQPDRALPPSPAHNQLLASAVRLMSAADERLATDGQQLLVNRKLSSSDKQLESADEQLAAKEHSPECEEPELCATKVIPCGWLDNTLPPPRCPPPQQPQQQPAVEQQLSASQSSTAASPPAGPASSSLPSTISASPPAAASPQSAVNPPAAASTQAADSPPAAASVQAAVSPPATASHQSAVSPPAAASTQSADCPGTKDDPKAGAAVDDPDGASQSTDECGSADSKSIYRIKWISWNKVKCGIITQNENGPCPLLSILNILLLRGKLTLPPGAEVVSAEQLLEYLGDLILSLSPNQNSQALDFQYNLNDAIAVLPKLQTGLDVNVKFTGVSDFEYTPECIIFDLLNVSLYHGWLVDPQMGEIVVAVNSLSYNQLVERIIANKASEDSALVSQALVGQQFLEESASQLTYHGLCELNTRMRDGELAVFFRNNHFSTIYKQDEELFLLVTDQGFLQQEGVVWETLSNIEGDGQFVDHIFQSSSGGKGGVAAVTGPPSEEQDRLLAESLQQEAALNTEGLSDEALAARLQEEEENLAAQEMTRRPNQPAGPSTSRGQPAVQQRPAAAEGPSNPIGPRTVKKEKNCSIS